MQSVAVCTLLALALWLATTLALAGVRLKRVVVVVAAS